MSILGIESLFCSSSEYMPRGHEVGILKGCLHSHSCVCACVHHCFRHDQPCVMLCTVARQSPVGISRQEYCSGLPCPSPGDLNPGIKLVSLTSPALARRLFSTNAPGKTTPIYIEALFQQSTCENPCLSLNREIVTIYIVIYITIYVCICPVYTHECI